MNYLLACGLTMLLLPVLWGPSLVMAVKLRRAGGPPARSRLLRIWPIQLAAVLLLCLVADQAGSTKPEIYAVVICALVSLAGAAYLWRASRAVRNA